MPIDWDAKVVGPNMKVFGEPITYAPASGSPFAISGVFDNAYTEINLNGDGSAVTSVHPALGVDLAEFASPPLQGDQFTIKPGTSAAQAFTVKEVRPDSHGWALLLANKS